VKIDNHSERGTHPPQEKDGEEYTASLKPRGAGDFFPNPDAPGVQQAVRSGGELYQRRKKLEVRLPYDYHTRQHSAVTQCPDGLELWNGQCLSPCSPGTTRNQLTGECVAPPCPDGQERVNGNCVPECAAGHYRDAQGQCVPIPAAGCPAGMELYKGTCVPECPPGQTRNAQGVCAGTNNGDPCGGGVPANAKPGDLVPDQYGPLIDNRLMAGIDFTATAEYIEHSAEWTVDSGEIKLHISGAAESVNVMYLAWGGWSDWMMRPTGDKARNPIPNAKFAAIEGQKFNWHDGWKTPPNVLIAVAWNASGAVAFKWPDQATRATAPQAEDALNLPHGNRYVEPQGGNKEMWNGNCVEKCSGEQHRNPVTGECESCPEGQYWDGTECKATDGDSGGGGSAAPPCPDGMERWNGNCVPKCGANEYRNAAGQCVPRPAVTLSGAWGNNTCWTYNDLNDPGERFHRIEPLANDFSVKPNYLATHGAPFKILRGMNWQNMNACRADKTGHAAHYAVDDPLNLHTQGFTGSAGGGTFAAGVHPLVFIRTCNALGVIPWVHVPWPTVAVNDRAWLREFAGWCQQSTAPNVIVECGNEPWNMGWPFMGGNLGVGKWAMAQGYSGIRLSPDGRQAWGSVEKGGLGMTKIIDEELRPVLGNKLITVVNFQSVENKSASYAEWCQEVGYTPDAFAIANYLRGVLNQPMTVARGREKMATEVARQQAARNAAHALGKMVCNYEFGIEQYNGIDYNSNRAGWEDVNRRQIQFIQSQDCATLITELGTHAQQNMDFGCMYRMVGFGVFGMMPDLDHPTPPFYAWKALQT